MRRSWLILIVAVCATCVNEGLLVAPRSESPAAATATGSRAGNSFTIASLGLSFRLSASFREAEASDLTFLARSIDPPAIFSILEEPPDVVDYQPEPGETIAPANIANVDKAVVVTHASIERLPPGVTSNELLVANGSRSFSVILSAREEAFAPLWEVFIASIRVTPT